MRANTTRRPSVGIVGCATHSLTEADIQSLIPRSRPNLLISTDLLFERRRWKALCILGVAGSKIEMLFVHAGNQGRSRAVTV
jgi:hypothetical protein